MAYGFFCIGTANPANPLHPEQALESLIERDGEWDVLLVERDMPVMDAFSITAQLRDFEKARRNRASTLRASAVEEHGRLASAAGYRHGMDRDVDGETRLEHGSSTLA